jgi:hypothetical protein
VLMGTNDGYATCNARAAATLHNCQLMRFAPVAMRAATFDGADKLLHIMKSDEGQHVALYAWPAAFHSLVQAHARTRMYNKM